MKKSELQSIIKEELKNVLKKRNISEASSSGPISKYFKKFSKDIIQSAYDIEEALLIAKVDEMTIAIVAGAVQDIVDAAIDVGREEGRNDANIGPGGFYK